MNDYKLILLKMGQSYDITKMAGGLQWRDNIDTLGMNLSFSKAQSLEKFIPKYKCEPGDKMILLNGAKELFRGIVVDNDFDKFSDGINAFDFAFYLNENDDIIQFKNVKADDALKKLCSKHGVPIGSIASMATKIKKIYKDKVSDIIKDILEQVSNENGKKYRLEMRAGKLFIEEYKNIEVQGTFKQSEKLNGIDIRSVPEITGIQRSISGMKNCIIVSTGENKILAKAKNQSSINIFGLLQEVIEVDEKDAAKARNIANTNLVSKNKINKAIKCKMLGDDNVRAGRIIKLNVADYGVVGKFLITDCSHRLESGIHTMELELEEI